MKRNPFVKYVLYLLLLAGILLFVFPVFLVFLNSLKKTGEILSNPLSFPNQVQFVNYLNAWKVIDIPKLFRNTTVITIGAIIGIVLFSSMLAWWCSRYPTRYSRLFSKLIIISMLIPFASLMIPLVKVTRVLRLNNSLYGIIIVYWGLGLSFSYFILQGAVRGIPRELEESAQIDGCGPLRTFWFIIFPLLQNAVISVVVMDIFFYWNDFMTQLILINIPRYETNQIAINRMFGMYVSKWDIALSALVITMLPVLVVFVLLQKRILDGIEDGAIKG
jgi:raffinose/stachyose/melibiose transport system permease protein